MPPFRNVIAVFRSLSMKAGAVADILGEVYHSRHSHASALLTAALAKLTVNR
jgi:hypothetical protein